MWNPPRSKPRARDQGQAMGKTRIPPESEEEEVRRDRESLGGGGDSSYCELLGGLRVSCPLSASRESSRDTVDTASMTVSLI